MPSKADLTNDSQQFDDSKEYDNFNQMVLFNGCSDDNSVATAPVNVPYAIPIPNNGGENVAGTPDFQVSVWRFLLSLFCVCSLHRILCKEGEYLAHIIRWGRHRQARAVMALALGTPYTLLGCQARCHIRSMVITK